jgi:tRNA (uracil-5-)-methyltransferase TRM9
MTQKTIDILNNLNKQFYNETGSIVWNQKPDYYWEGWYQLTKYFKESEKLIVETKNPINYQLEPNISIGKHQTNNTYKILDLGCGNTRFANFINSEFDIEQTQNTQYLGIDFSINFLQQSQSYIKQNFDKFELKELDIIKELDQLDGQKFDLIAVFGLIHHIPSLQARKLFFTQICKLLNPDSLLIFTTWQYLDTPRLIKRVIDPETETGKSVYKNLGIKKSDLEIGDNILDWVKKVFSYRYSHYFSESEIQNYITDNDLRLIHSFVCDGRDSKRNKYYICKLESNDEPDNDPNLELQDNLRY